MEPRGKVTLLIDAMKAQPEKSQWTATDCAKAMGVQECSLATRLLPAINRGWIVKTDLPGRRVAYSLPVQQEDDGPSEAFRCDLHGDGDLDLYGLIELENGGFRLTREQALQVRGLLTGELFLSGEQLA